MHPRFIPTLCVSLLAATAANAQFTVPSSDGKSKLRVGGLIQADTHAFTGSGNTGNSTLTVRRARIALDGTLGNLVDLRVMPDFGDGRALLQDAYVDLHVRPNLGLRAGKFKVPFSLERLQAAADVAFVERSLANNVIPVRDVGAMLHHDAGGDGLEWQFGVFNGVPDNVSGDGNGDNSFETAARVFWQPKHFAQGLGIGLAATSGTSTEALSGEVLRSAGRSAIFKYADGVAGAGLRSRLSPQAYYYHGPWSFLGERNTTRQKVAKGAVRRTDTHAGYTAQVGYVLTGESAAFRGGVVPAHAYDPATGRGGALELVVRWASLRTDDGTFAAGLADPVTSARKADALSVGVNAYLSRTVKAQIGVERTDFGAPVKFATGNRRYENALLTELQVAF